MKTKAIPSQWLIKNGHRMDCNPYMGGAVEARAILEKLACQKQPLADLTTGIYHAGREGRKWVETEEFGVPFLGSTDILKSDLSHLPLISKQQVANNPAFTIHKGWTLITRSGTIGRMAYARPDMDGMACSEHVMRVVPDTNEIPSGYLYAYLNSKFGVPIVVSGTYGSIIQSIEPHHIAALPVPRLGDTLESEIHRLVEEAAELRASAIELLAQGRQNFYDEFRVDVESYQADVTDFSINEISSRNLSRLDAVFFSESGRKATELLASVSDDENQELGRVATVFTPGIFKRPYVDDPSFGYPYFSGSELFLNDAEPRGYLNKRAQNIENYVVKKNWLLIQDAGQLGGLIGKVVRVNHFENNAVVSNHLMRIASENDTDAGYLFAVISSIVGYHAIVKNAFGTSIPQLDPAHIGKMKIPWPDKVIRQRIANPVLKAWSLQDRAIEAERGAVSKTEQAIEQAAQVKH